MKNPAHILSQKAFDKFKLVLLLLSVGATAFFASAQTSPPFYNFGYATQTPVGSLVASGNTLYGATSAGGEVILNGGGIFGGALFSIDSGGENFSAFFIPTNGPQGLTPGGGLLLANGTLYGVFAAGGTLTSGKRTEEAYGTVFMVKTNGSGYKVLHNFAGNFIGTTLPPDGAMPLGRLALSGDTLYGITTYGGTSNLGTIFSVSTSGSGYKMVHSFGGQPDGESPEGGLTLYGNMLYGVTYRGGSNNLGTVFSLNTSNIEYQIIHHFSAPIGYYLLYTYDGVPYDYGTNRDGAYPDCELFVTNDTIYGTAEFDGEHGFGTVYSMDTSGGNFFTVHSFATSPTFLVYGTNLDGASPESGVILVSNTLYGTTYDGGQSGGGNLFSVNTNGNDFNVLDSFAFVPNSSGLMGAANPSGSLLLFKNTIFGTTLSGGYSSGAQVDDGDGTIFDYPLPVDTTGTGALQVNFDPNLAITDGAEWQVDNGILQNNGNVVSGLSPGDHTLTFIPLPGFTTPTSQTVVISPGATNIATGTYVSNDSTRPVLTFTYPKTGTKSSNDTYYVTGTVTDKVPINGVYVSSNGIDWFQPTMDYGWTNWSMGPGLNPGTNTFLAYAVDSVGNISVTDALKIIYIQTATISVGMMGEGSIKTDYNGDTLILNEDYSMTAKADKGFAFRKWTDGDDITQTTNATLKFMMASNLVFVAVFADVTAPTESITSPKANAKVTGPTVTVTGKASDNVGVTNVLCQINNGGWVPAAGSNSFATWTLTGVPIVTGANVLESYSVDGAGNMSKTNVVKFTGIQ